MIKHAKERAVDAADQLKKHFSLEKPPDVGIIFGTGWGDLLTLEGDKEDLPFHEIPHFAELESLEGHRRVISVGGCGGKTVIALRGRVHLNEAFADKRLIECVRLQMQMLLELGTRTFILTNAAGALGGRCKVGDVVVTNGFISLYAPEMPLYVGEFCSPDDILDPELLQLALDNKPAGINVKEGGYIMVRGPHFEGRKYDKVLLGRMGPDCIGMSTLPEACVIALYKDEGAKAVALSYITNDDKEEHSHEENVRRAKEDADKLGKLLTNICAALPG